MQLDDGHHAALTRLLDGALRGVTGQSPQLAQPGEAFRDRLADATRHASEQNLLSSKHRWSSLRQRPRVIGPAL
jgi:hypothetical protein